MYKKVFVYSSITPTILSHEFISCSEVALHFSCHITTISKYLKSSKLFQGKWILSLASPPPPGGMQPPQGGAAKK
jgi:hypothetical protein